VQRRRCKSLRRRSSEGLCADTRKRRAVEAKTTCGEKRRGGEGSKGREKSLAFAFDDVVITTGFGRGQEPRRSPRRAGFAGCNSGRSKKGPRTNETEGKKVLGDSRDGIAGPGSRSARTARGDGGREGGPFKKWLRSHAREGSGDLEPGR